MSDSTTPATAPSTDSRQAPSRRADVVTVVVSPRTPHSVATDVALCALARAGDQEAVAELWRRHYPYAKVVARRFAGNPSDADDLAAEAFTRILTLLNKGAGPEEHVRTYVARSVRNVATDRARRCTVPTTDLEEARDIAAQDDVAREAEAIIELADALAALAECSGRQRYAIWQTALEGRNVADLAAEFGITPNAVSAVLVRARASILRIMANRSR
ncbi:RNA polymerase sigma factor [Cellulosimicrobium funkei]|uniref:RNA polymerase sigma factor n=1 Tax=Cellulosimicrobium funkei TaxID=264251 RepID=UPI00368FFF98